MNLDFSSFEKALGSLQRVLDRSRTVPGDEDIRDACIQRFEYTYELAFKMLKRQLEQELPSSEELDQLPFKEVIRVGAERGLIRVPERPSMSPIRFTLKEICESACATGFSVKSLPTC